MPCSWEGNRRSGISTGHAHVTDISGSPALHLQAQALEEGDEHPPIRSLVEHGWLYLYSSTYIYTQPCVYVWLYWVVMVSEIIGCWYGMWHADIDDSASWWMLSKFDRRSCYVHTAHDKMWSGAVLRGGSEQWQFVEQKGLSVDQWLLLCYD